MKTQFIWQRKDWPNFKWGGDDLALGLGKSRKTQGQILAQAKFIGLEAQANILIEDAFTTSAIEGEKLNRASIRSSVARKMGLPTAGLPAQQRNIEGLVEMLLDATTNHATELTAARLHGWNAGLFPTGHSGINKINVGYWRTEAEPMQVISGPIGKERIHFEAPPSKIVPQEMKAFLRWWNNPPAGLDGLLRAGIAHLWFVTIHPYEDGNGRIARAITDMALAQDEETGIRLYSLSSQINAERNDYYRVLEMCQKQGCDVTLWLDWFLGCLARAIGQSQKIVEASVAIAQFWQRHAQVPLNERQRKVIQRLLEAGATGFQGGMTNRKYVSLTRASRESAKRDLSDLEEKGLITRNPGGGRSISYSLKWP